MTVVSVGAGTAVTMHLSLESDGGRKQAATPSGQQHPVEHPVEIITISRQVQQVPHGRQQSVIREQYCSCAPQTRNEQVMLVVIIVMAFCIVGLVAALGAVTKTACDPRHVSGRHASLI